jgi:hypothetical protein
MRSAGGGQQTFDQDLVYMAKQELISHQEAIRNATNREQLTMALRGISNSRNITEPARGVGGAQQPQKPVSTGVGNHDVDKLPNNHGSGPKPPAPPPRPPVGHP